MKFIVHIIIAAVIGLGAIYLFQEYRDDIYYALFDTPAEYTIFVSTVAMKVTLADESSERKLGLSGTESLGDLEGKLFLFDEARPHGIWMKDMLIPIDIIWINNDLEIIYIEKLVYPDTYPKIFAPDSNARYVLETKALFVDTYKIKVGDRLTLPPGLLPSDVRARLLQQ